MREKIYLKDNKSYPSPWSVESLPSNPAARVRFPAESGILISVLGLGVSPVLSPAEDLTLCWPHIPGGLPLCIGLLFWSKYCCYPYRHLTHGYLGCFTYVTAHSLTLSLLHLRHSSYSNPSEASLTSQLILQPFRRFIYVTTHSPTLPPFHVPHKHFTWWSCYNTAY